ncbi:MAG: hypothetical protein ACTS6G_02975 [Candidatus Hodgkinia cicadicola]
MSALSAPVWFLLPAVMELENGGRGDVTLLRKGTSEGLRNVRNDFS